MTSFAFVTWDGGGNVVPAVGIAQELLARGHEVRFHGYRAQQEPIASRGLAFAELERSGRFDIYGDIPVDQRMAEIVRNVWACPEHLEDARALVARTRADVLVIDFSMQGALAAARLVDVPVAVLAHSGIGALVPSPQSPAGAARLESANRLRAAVGLPQLRRLEEAWEGLPTLVTTIPELDPAAESAPPYLHYVGPIREVVTSDSWPSPWAPNDDRPLVVASFSTTALWDRQRPIARTLTALASAPVRVLVSSPVATGMTLPPNAAAVGFVPHDLVLPDADLLVTHCGHGTVTAALAHAVPILGLPNPMADQPFLANRVQELGAGIALPGEAGVDAVHKAAMQILEQPSFRDAAARLGESIRTSPGAAGAAGRLEQVARSPSKGGTGSRLDRTRQ
jgi:MGT family glycosyltransferase